MLQVDSRLFPLGWLAPPPFVPKCLLELVEIGDEELLRFANELIFQAGPGNVGAVYIGNKRMNLETGDGIILVLPGPGDAVSFSSFLGNVYRLEDFYVTVEVEGDGLLVSAFIR